MINFKLVYYDFKNLRGYYFVPIFVLFILIPVLTAGMVKMSGSVGNAYFLVFREIEKYIPIFSVWWITFIFREFIEGEGNEVLYCTGKSSGVKVYQVLTMFVWYIFHVSILFLGYSMFWDNVFLEYVKTVIQSFFFTSFAYMLIYVLRSTTISFMLLFVYELFMLFINSEIVKYLSIFQKGEIMAVDSFLQKYLLIIIISIMLIFAGVYKNKKFYF